MPDLNLNDEDAMEEQPSEEPSQPEESAETEASPRRERGGEMTRVIVIFVVLGVLGGAVYMVNKLGIVKLWGTSEQVVAQVEELPADEQTPTEEETQPRAEDPAAAQQAAEQATQQAASQSQQVQAQPPPPPSKPVETPKVEEKKKAEMPFKLLDPIQFPKRQRTTQTAAQQSPPVQQPVQVATVERQEPPPERKMESKPAQQQPAAPAKKEPIAQATPQKQAPKQSSQPAQTKPAEQLPKVDMASLSDMKGTYTVQVYALRDKGNAETAVQRLTEAGYPAFVEPIEARQMMWYTVRIGKYPSAADAKSAVENFAQEIKMHHFIDKVRMTGN